MIPQIPGGVTSVAQLRRIADVAEKYNVPRVKLTGRQRIDLVGIPREELPNVWRDLDMPSGFAYAKRYRTCKSCIGTDYCRYGLGVGGAAGAHVRKGDLLCTVDSHAQVLLIAGHFIQYYRENAKCLERTYGFVERMGVEKVRDVVVNERCRWR